MKRVITKSLFGSVAALALMSSGTAMAQEASDSENEEIIVTAQKREQALQDVPLTITVVTAKQLDRQSITNVQDVQNAAPELNFIGQPSSGYSIRGSGTSTFSRSAENNVLVVVDGVVLGQLTPPTNSLFDLAQVEVLSGPQGMLFGKNASAGVVNIVTKSPRLDISEFFGRLSAGEDGYIVGNAMANIPLGSTAALRITASHDRRNGITFNEFTDRRIDDFKNSAIRGRLLWEPSESLTFNLIADYEKQKGGNNAWTARISPNTSATSIGGRLAACGVVPSPTNTEVCLDGEIRREIEGAGASLQADLDLGGHVLTSITAYRNYKRDVNTDSDTRPINALNRNEAFDDIKQWTQEVRLASSDSGPLTYVVGAFFYDYQYNSLTNQGGTLGLLPFVATRSNTDDVVQKSYAIFGQAEFDVTDQITLIAGARQTWDKLDLTDGSFVNPALGVRFAPAFSPATDTMFSRSVSTNNFSFRLGAQFKPSKDVTFFATYSRGYKGPAINPSTSIAAAPRVVKPEIPTNIEVGVKAVAMDGAVRADLSFFDMVSKNFQAQTTVVDGGGITRFVFANASKLNFRGAQLNVALTPARGFNINWGVLYNKATYGDFIVQCNAPYLTGCAFAPGTTTNVINAKGRQLAGAPKWKVTLGASYETDISQSLVGFIDSNIAFRSRIYSSATPDPNLVIQSYDLVDGRIGVRTNDDRYQLSIFAKNLFDKRAAGLLFRDPLSPTGNYMQSFVSNAVRTIGATFEVRF